MLTIAFYGIKDVFHPSRWNNHFCAAHDHNITIIKDGKLLKFIELERYTDIKHDCRLEEYIEKIIEQCVPNYQIENIIFISVNSFLGNSFISNSGRLRIEPKNEIKVENILSKAKTQFYEYGLTKNKNVKGYIMTHEFAHVASCLPFFGRFKENSLLIHIDGGAYESSSSVWYYDENQIQCLDYGWDDLKDVVNNYNTNPLSFFILGESPLNHLSLPGKLMGYSAYGKTKKKIREWLRANNYFLNFTGSKIDMLELINKEFDLSLQVFNTKTQIFMDIAASFQFEFERKILAFIKKYKDQTNAKYLYYAGGAALNIKTNSLIEKECGFKKIFIPPCCSDSGLSLGAAFYYEFLNNNKIQRLSPFLNNFAFKKTIKKNNDKKNTRKINKKQSLISEICSQLVKGKIIGVCTGPSEAGPRALGHRSIIARPDSIEIKKRVSEQIKGREWYRPIAPIITDYIGNQVIQEKILESTLSLYMLGNYHLKEEFWPNFKGIVHIDGSVRAQIVLKDHPETFFIYSILKQLDKKYGIKGLINTSFNIKGKPIIHKLINTLKEGEKMGLDGVILDKRLYKF